MRLRPPSAVASWVPRERSRHRCDYPGNNHGAHMPDRSECRRMAAECIALARTLRDVRERNILLVMAQKWHELANEPVTDLNMLLQDFNERQMTMPFLQHERVQQQQQQQQRQSPPEGKKSEE